MRRLPTRWGLSLPNRGVLFGLTDTDTILRAAALAETSGIFESVWFGDSLIHKPRLESIVMLSAAAARTTKVRLGVMCMASFPVRHPERRAFGARRSERVARMTESIELLRKLWTKDEVSHAGRFYQLERCQVVPKPAQKPCPIWIAVSPDRKAVGDAVVDNAMQRVATLADGYITMGVEAAEFHRRWEVIERTAREIGKDLSNFETAIHGMVNINDDRRAAYVESQDYFSHYYS